MEESNQTPGSQPQTVAGGGDHIRHRGEGFGTGSTQESSSPRSPQGQSRSGSTLWVPAGGYTVVLSSPGTTLWPGTLGNLGSRSQAGGSSSSSSLLSTPVRPGPPTALASDKATRVFSLGMHPGRLQAQGRRGSAPRRPILPSWRRLVHQLRPLPISLRSLPRRAWPSIARIGTPTWRDWAGGSRAHLVLAAIGIGSPGPMLQGVCEGATVEAAR